MQLVGAGIVLSYQGESEVNKSNGETVRKLGRSYPPDHLSQLVLGIFGMALGSNHGHGHTAADGHISRGQTHSSLMRNHLRLPSFLPSLPSITSSTYPAAAATVDRAADGLAS